MSKLEKYYWILVHDEPNDPSKDGTPVGIPGLHNAPSPYAVAKGTMVTAYMMAERYTAYYGIRCRAVRLGTERTNTTNPDLNHPGCLCGDECRKNLFNNIQREATDTTEDVKS